jgi:hypothetical protein
MRILSVLFALLIAFTAQLRNGAAAEKVVAGYSSISPVGLK